MMELDHIAISGKSLEDATAYVEGALGVPLQPGGAHAVFHTHNSLLGLADGLYLEAIAINPQAPSPDRPRWFDLDRFSGSPRVTNWICRCDDMEAMLAAVDLELGAPVALTRGDLRWRMAVPNSGCLPFDNRAPALIEWQSSPHPASSLTQQGVRLTRLSVAHPEATVLSAALRPFIEDHRIVFEQGASGLRAEFETPHGVRVLE